MAQLDVTELDFDSIKANLRNFLEGQEEFSDFNFEGKAEFQKSLHTLKTNKVELSASTKKANASKCRYWDDFLFSVSGPDQAFNVHEKEDNGDLQVCKRNTGKLVCQKLKCFEEISVFSGQK